MTAPDTETRAAVAALVHRLRNRTGADDEQFAGEFVTALLSRGWRPPLAPSADEGEGGIREAVRELLAFACATRQDWTEEETWAAVHAAKTASLEWDKLASRLVAIALTEAEPPTRPRELWDYARGITSKVTGVPPAAGYLAVKAARGWGTGEQPVLTEGNDDRRDIA